MTDTAERVTIRGHHLFCLQFCHGTGYSADFARNVMQVRSRFETDGAVVVRGQDDVCQACPQSTGQGECSDSCTCEDSVAALDGLALDLLGLEPGDEISLHEIDDSVDRSLQEWQDRACANCEWETACHSAIELRKIPPITENASASTELTAEA